MEVTSLLKKYWKWSVVQWSDISFKLSRETVRGLLICSVCCVGNVCVKYLGLLWCGASRNCIIPQLNIIHSPNYSIRLTSTYRNHWLKMIAFFNMKLFQKRMYFNSTSPLNWHLWCLLLISFTVHSEEEAGWFWRSFCPWT